MTEPVTLEEIKQYLRLDGNEHDAILTALIIAARQYCEAYQNRSYITRTLEYIQDNWKFPMYLPNGPVQSVYSMTYTDSGGQTYPFMDFIADVEGENARIALFYNASVPTSPLQALAAIRIRYVAGYGDASQVPEPVKLAIKMFVAHRFENPEVDGIPQAVHYLLWPNRVVPI